MQVERQRITGNGLLRADRKVLYYAGLKIHNFPGYCARSTCASIFFIHRSKWDCCIVIQITFRSVNSPPKERLFPGGFSRRSFSTGSIRRYRIRHFPKVSQIRIKIKFEFIIRRPPRAEWA